MSAPAQSGVFITFEGVEGGGKSTQLAFARELCARTGRGVEIVREPGGTRIGEAIRAILLDPAHNAMTPVAELLLYEAARAQVVAERIRPALEAGRVVISDRFYDSTTAYQGAGRGLDIAFLTRLNAMASDNLKPDLTILLDLPVHVGLSRAAKRNAADRLESEHATFHERVREGFLQIAREDPDRVKVVDGAQPVETVRAAIERLIAPKLGFA